MKGLKQVNKLIGEGVKSVNRLGVKTPVLGHSRTDTPFTTWRNKFCLTLQKNGYQTKSKGNYIIATKGKEVVTFFFAAHHQNNHNYLVPSVLKNEVNYFAFYNNSTNCVYLVGYGIVRKYCKSIKDAHYFYGSELKLFVPDEWARQQQINTYRI